MKKETLDAKHILCPLPVIRTQDKVKTLTTGDQLTVVCTDPGVMSDIPAWCRINGHTVIATRNDGYTYIIELQVGVA